MLDELLDKRERVPKTAAVSGGTITKKPPAHALVGDIGARADVTGDQEHLLRT
jgi:hypothetical protein